MVDTLANPLATRHGATRKSQNHAKPGPLATQYEASDENRNSTNLQAPYADQGFFPSASKITAYPK